MTVQQVKALRKLQPQGLDDVAIKVLSDGLRSEGLGVVEAALDVCAAHTGGATAAPLSHAWPRAPAAALPMMAAALVEAAKRSDDGGAMLLRLTASRPDGGGAADLAAAVSVSLAVSQGAAAAGAAWPKLRSFALNFLFHGSGSAEGYYAAADAYARVELHSAALAAVRGDPQLLADVALLPLCYCGGGVNGDGWGWIFAALRELSSGEGLGLKRGDALLQQQLCVNHALELALANRSALPPLRLLSSRGGTRATAQRLLVAAAHLLCVLPGVAERATLLRWLKAECAFAECEQPLVALMIAVTLREMHR